MIRIAWPTLQNSYWMGGVNYFCNLAKACSVLPNPRLQVHLLGDNAHLPKPLSQLPSLTPVRFKNNVSKGKQLASFLEQNGIAAWSHGIPLGRRSPVPALCWIPDFQHVHMPAFFSEQEILQRDANIKKIAEESQAVIVSSANAREDFCALYPKQAYKAHVLRFVADVPAESALPPFETVSQHYNIAEPYFHVPNQLWAHKNHKVIIQALGILHKKNKPVPLVICTGNTDDYRNPEHFKILQDTITNLGVADRFIFLGVLPYDHVATLMQHSMALINPSYFEGWSTTVEEAKSLGKHILLSDLAVHKEQNPSRSAFFDPDDAETLAALMETLRDEYRPEQEQLAMQQAAACLSERMVAYGLDYENLIVHITSTYQLTQ